MDQLPIPGGIGHALRTLQEPAGGGAVAAVQMARLQRQPVQFFTALGRDSVGEACVKRLEDLGLEVHVAWREAPTRRGVSLVDGEGDRAITVIGRVADPITGRQPSLGDPRRVRRPLCHGSGYTSVESLPLCCSPGGDSAGSFACASGSQSFPRRSYW